MRKSARAAAVFWFFIAAGALFSMASVHAQTDEANAPAAHDFSFSNYEGETVRLEDFRGKVALINSWATWCPFCVNELPDFAELAREYPDRVRVVAINRAEPLERAKEFTDTLGVTGDIIFLLDPEDDYYERIGGFTMPETIFVDAEGEVVSHKRGFMALPEIKQRTRDALAASGLLEGQDAVTTDPPALDINIAFGSAFLAGLLMFLAPCTLPLVPAFLSLISGVSSRDLAREESARRAKFRVFLNGLFFVLGFTLVFITLGTLAGLLGSSIAGFQKWSRWIGGALIVVFGLLMLGIFRVSLFERGSSALRIPSFVKVGKPTSSFLIGSAFAVGWTPCVGPILAGILTLATTEQSAGQGALLLSVFSIGLALPFLLIAGSISSATNRILSLFDFIKRHRVLLLSFFGALAGFLGNVTAFAVFSILGAREVGEFLQVHFYILPVVVGGLLGWRGFRNPDIDVVSVVGGLFLVLLGLLVLTNSFSLLVSFVFELLEFTNYEEALYEYF